MTSEGRGIHAARFSPVSCRGRSTGNTNAVWKRTQNEAKLRPKTWTETLKPSEEVNSHFWEGEGLDGAKQRHILVHIWSALRVMQHRINTYMHVFCACVRVCAMKIPMRIGLCYSTAALQWSLFRCMYAYVLVCVCVGDAVRESERASERASLRLMVDADGCVASERERE